MNLIRPAALEMFLNGDLDWTSQTWELVLLEATYVYDDAHDFLNDVPAGDRAFTHTLTGKTSDDGIAGAASAVITIPAGPAITQAWLYMDSGAEATSPLVAYYDTDENNQPFNFTPTGIDVNLVIPLLPYGLFQV